MNSTVPRHTDFTAYPKPPAAFQKLTGLVLKRYGLSGYELVRWTWQYEIKSFNAVLNIPKSFHRASKVTLLVLAAVASISSVSLADEVQTLITTNGHRYEKARITEVTPISITIFHSTGVSRVPLSEFPPNVQRRFGYDEDKARAWLAQQAKLEEVKKQQVATGEAAKRKEAERAAHDVGAISHYLDDGGHLQYDPLSKRLYDPDVEAARRRQAFNFYQRHGYWPVRP